MGKEKYTTLAKEALTNGDKILSENYLQHSDHFSRILMAQDISRNQHEKEPNIDTNQVKVEIENKEPDETTVK